MIRGGQPWDFKGRKDFITFIKEIGNEVAIAIELNHDFAVIPASFDGGFYTRMLRAHGISFRFHFYAISKPLSFLHKFIGGFFGDTFSVIDMFQNVEGVHLKEVRTMLRIDFEITVLD